MGALGEDLSAVLKADFDELFSYCTRQQVQVRDIRLGVLEKLFQACVMLYIVVGVFFLGESYYEVDVTPGMISASVRGGGVGINQGGRGTSRYFSDLDMTGPAIENGPLFLTTKVGIHQQVRGVCEDVEKPCQSAADCSGNAGATCSKDGFCVEPSWCPASDAFEVYKVPLDDVRIWVKSAVSFNSLDPKVYVNKFDAPIPFPQPKFNTFSVKDILVMCDPPVHFAEISELGTAIELQFSWNCIVGNPLPCEPKVQAKRIDTRLDSDSIGFSYKVVTPMGEDTREIQERHGIRLYFKTVGLGAKVSISEIIKNFSMGLSLMNLVPMITDFIMLQICANKNKYSARKHLQSPNLSEILEELEGQDSGAGCFGFLKRSGLPADPMSKAESRDYGEEVLQELILEDEQWKAVLDEDRLDETMYGRGRGSGG